MNNLLAAVIEDNEEYIGKARENLKPYFEQRGISLRINECLNTFKGLQVLLRLNPQLVILDINFDRSDDKNKAGLYEVLVPAREQGYNGYIICWSSEAGWEDEALKAGANRFVRKDNPEGLRKLLDEFMASRK